ncbi:MAG: alpha/beta family hydrolase [Dehalococcoidia bacterium]
MDCLRPIAVGKGEVSSLWTLVTDNTRPCLVYAPGAGAGLSDPFGEYLAGHLHEHGISLVRFQFPYAERRQRRPDPPAVLLATWRAVLQSVGQEYAAVVASGRSMGGRIASMVAAEASPLTGLAVFAYPLQPPNASGTKRAAHFPDITVPTLFCSGTRDTFATPEQLQAAASAVPNARVHLLQGADHGFNVLKSSGRTREAVWAEAVDATVNWLGQ